MKSFDHFNIMIYSLILLVIAVSFSAAEQCVPIDCSSWGYKFATCPVPGADVITRMNVARKYSKSACNYGTSYGKGQGTIWVNKGCRAKFNVCYETGISCTSLDCSSWGYKFSACPVPGARVVTSVRVARKYSRSSCRYGHGFGKDGNKIWVNHGCRANFEVCYAAF